MTKAVLQDMANAAPKGMAPSASPSKSVNLLPPTVASGEHWTWVSGVVPWVSSASAVTILNVEPGG